MAMQICQISEINRFSTTKVQKLMDVASGVVPPNEINELDGIVFVLKNGKEYKTSLEQIGNEDNNVFNNVFQPVIIVETISNVTEETISNVTEEPSDSKRENTLRAKMLMMFGRIALKNEFQFSNIKYEYDLHDNKFYTDYFVTRNTKRNIYRFFHTKYETRIGRMITLNDLRQTYSDYSIRKYFHSFCKAIEGDPNFENNLTDFNIITNTEFDSTIEYFKEEPLKKDDEFLFIKEGAKVCTFNCEKFEKLEELINIFFGSEEKNNNKIELFLKKFKFITNYPREDYIDSWIKYELNESFYLLNSNLMSSTSDQALSDILKTKFEVNNMIFLTLEKGKEFLDRMKDSIDALIISSINKDYIDQLQSFGVSFEMGEEDEIYKLRKSKKVFEPIVLSSECTQLTVIKFLQAYEKTLFDTKNGYIFMQAESLMFQREREIVKTFFCSKDGPNLLLIECQHESISQDEFEYIFWLCVQWLPKEGDSTKKCIFIINDQFKYKDADLIEIEQISFKHLTQEAKEHVMKKPVNFQGMLKDHLNVDEANEMIDSNCLWQILSEQLFEL